MANKPINANVSAQQLAETTLGFSGADLENLVNEAAILAARENLSVIEESHFRAAWDKIKIGLCSGEKRSEIQQRRTAYHEIGHVLIKLLYGFPVSKVTIIPRGRTLGFTHSVPKYESVSDYTSEELKQYIMACQGGCVAENIFFGQSSPGVCSDLNRAHSCAKDMVKLWGMGKELGGIAAEGFSSEYYAKVCDDEVHALLSTCLKQTEQLIRDNAALCEKLVKRLIDKESLDQKEIEEIYADFKKQQQEQAKA